MANTYTQMVVQIVFAVLVKANVITNCLNGMTDVEDFALPDFVVQAGATWILCRMG